MAEKQEQSRQDNAPSGLSKALILELWSKTYNTNGKPDWSHLFPYYHPEIVFQDSIQRIEGIDAFQALMLSRQCVIAWLNVVGVCKWISSHLSRKVRLS